MPTTVFRPLYLVSDLAKAAGQEVTYAYDDLAFISHSEIVVQFSPDKANALDFFLHVDLSDEDASQTKARYLAIAEEQKTALTYKGRFGMKANEETNEINLEFFPE